MLSWFPLSLQKAFSFIACRERQPGDGEADADEEKSIRTVYSHSYHSRSASSCSTALTVQSDGGSDTEDDVVDDDVNIPMLPSGKQPENTYRSRFRSSSRCRSVLDDDDDITNIASDSDSDTSIDSADHHLDDTVIDMDPAHSSLSRREKSRSLQTLPTDSDVDDNSSDDDIGQGDERRHSVASRRSRSASRLSNVPSESEKTKELTRPKSAAAISFTSLRERFARKTTGKKGKSPLLPSNFEFVPPCIRFVVDGQKSEFPETLGWCSFLLKIYDVQCWKQNNRTLLERT